MAIMYGIVSFYLPDGHRYNTMIATSIFGYYAAMMRDYYYGNSGPTAIDPRDDAIGSAKDQVRRSIDRVK